MNIFARCLSLIASPPLLWQVFTPALSLQVSAGETNAQTLLLCSASRGSATARDAGALQHAGSARLITPFVFTPLLLQDLLCMSQC